MTLEKVAIILEAERIHVGKPIQREVTKICASDLMSDVLTLVKHTNTLLLTGLVNPQVIRTAEVAEIVAICFVRGKKPLEDTVKLAKVKNIPLLSTQLCMYDACGKLYSAGLKGMTVEDAG